MSRMQKAGKRVFDIAFSLLVICITLPFILIAIALATLDTRQFGLFTQQRVGRHGRLFRVCKVRTMRNAAAGPTTTVTKAGDVRITRVGRLLRRTKLDELPQFFNVLAGNMSVVGPRPDVPGYADRLRGDNRVLLTVRPGITGPASIYVRDEEKLLGSAHDSEQYNDTVLWPFKVRINLDYLENYSFLEDVRLIADTAWPSLRWSRAARQRIDAEENGREIFADTE